ncbi:MAG TPA: macro domain-containing protein [Solirubrobacterales bacterium]|jgi:O-acetyl-ADP-ribose deacetylase (regulator of RNase III)
MSTETGDGPIEVVRADLTRQPVDAIVNAANSQLSHGGGVARAISSAAGPQLQRASDELIAASGPVPTGEAVATEAFDLPCRMVVHVVGPVYGRHGGDEARLLAAAHRNSIALAAELGLRSVAFPAISCGIYGYPLDEAAPVALSATLEALQEQGDRVELVRFCLFGERELAAFEQALAAA